MIQLKAMNLWLVKFNYKNKIQFIVLFLLIQHKKENDLTSEFDLVNKKLQPSAICNMILEKASFLKRK